MTIHTFLGAGFWHGHLEPGRLEMLDVGPNAMGWILETSWLSSTRLIIGQI